MYNGEVSYVLPPHQSFDHVINIQAAKGPPSEPCYAHSEEELSVLWEYIKEMFNQGTICPGQSTAGAPILLVSKSSERGGRLYIDYRGLPYHTIVSQRPLPVMNTLQDRIQGAAVFTKIDRETGFHLIQVTKGDGWKIAICMRFSRYENTVMPFGLVNTPATFQYAMETIFGDMLNSGHLINMDYFLIWSETAEEHFQIVMEVIRRLKEYNLAIASDKCV